MVSNITSKREYLFYLYSFVSKHIKITLTFSKHYMYKTKTQKACQEDLKLLNVIVFGKGLL